jgi:3-hydroxypropanoate dehydrogenase
VLSALQPAALDQLFRTARSHNEWSETPVDEPVVRELYDLLKWGPTSANSCPARFVWVRSPEGKSQLASLAMDKNRPKILAAPLTVIIGNDLDFPEMLPKLFPDRGEMLRDVPAAGPQRDHGDAQCDSAGRLSDYRGARPGPGLRADVRLRQCCR